MGTFLLAVVLTISYTLLSTSKPVESKTMQDGTKMKFRTQQQTIEIYQNESWSPLTVKGVNLGATLPGYYPGSLPLDQETYKRWFKSMKDMGVNTVRIYTIHEPVFYESLVEFNQNHPEDPLYFIQGIWSPVEQLRETDDARAPEVTAAFKEEIERAVGAVYGETTIKENAGKASGTFDTNAAPYLLAWHLGTEWDPKMVQNTNKTHEGEDVFKGESFRATNEANPFESWLSELLDYTAQLEKEKGWQHPMTFTNWVTTDPLEHPEEPLIMEDRVSVDATHIKEQDWDGGYFASFHAYPYYPDFLRLGKAYKNVLNEEGKPDAYKGYLKELKEYHKEMPIMITEFGLPSSLGVAHLGRYNRDQGGHSEEEQGKMNAELYELIADEGYAGVALFTWQDEWFKKTWNTMPYVEQGRRAYWFNYLSSETSYGLIGMYPGLEDDIRIDGSNEEWGELKKVQTHDVENGPIETISFTHDEGFVYMNARFSEDYEIASEPFRLGVNTLPGGSDVSSSEIGVEALITLSGEEGEVKLSSGYDPHHRLYKDEQAAQPSPDQKFVPWKLPVSLKFEPPNTRHAHPFEDVGVGGLKRGDAGAFKSKDYDPQAFWEMKGNVIEMKIPWALLGFSDPSQRKVVSYPDQKESSSITTESVKSIEFLPLIGEEHETSFSYTWDEWSKVNYSERKKSSFYYMKEALSN
ncbi:hypothetical protein [Pontibacillus chungwhensis]|uniref:hypothetical protein n=1 Tax=Pontibacillus chungwhensis TaxID=265426 RepID=UPI001E43A3B3|nr:hypothetical protein [Pontibacillus chungwhensis]